MTETERKQLSDRILIQVKQIKWPIINRLLTYEPMRQFAEFDPTPIEAYFQKANSNMLLYTPRVNTNTNQLEVVQRVTGNSFVNKYGTLEYAGPSIDINNIDAVIVPLLAFDKNGYRVGFGKGFYDRLIKNSNPKLLKIGFSFFDPIVIDNVDEWDETLSMCITPDKVYHFEK